MVGTSLPSTSLPKSASLTDAFISPSTRLVDQREFRQLRRDFECELGEAAGPLPANERVRVDAYHLRNSISGNVEPDGSFRWTPWTARRPIGIECVRACLANPRLTPLQATHDVITRLVGRAVDERQRPGSLAEWLSGLGVGGRAVVQAEAVVWATQLQTALDWSRIDRPIVGRDHSVVLPTSSQVLLRGRIEVQSRASSLGPLNKGKSGDTRDVSPAVLFSIMTGRPTPTARTELGLAALTVALDDRHGESPTRVVGWWPQSGRALVVPVDLALLGQTCEAVVAAVRSARPARPRQLHSSRKRTTEFGEAKRQRSAPRALTGPVVDVERAAS